MFERKIFVTKIALEVSLKGILYQDQTGMMRLDEKGCDIK